MKMPWAFSVGLVLMGTRLALSVPPEPERSLTVVARRPVSLARVFMGDELLCDLWDGCSRVSLYLLERAPGWLDED